MPFVLCLIVAFILGDVQGQQCPHNDIQGITSDGSRAVPLTSPLCFRCLYLVGGNVIFPTDITWSRGPSPFITLTNDSMNGNVLIDPNTDILILPNPINVINVGNTLRCNSASQGQHEITITQFIFRNPILSPDGGSDMIADVTEGTDLTLSCNDPGNTGT